MDPPPKHRHPPQSPVSSPPSGLQPPAYGLKIRGGHFFRKKCNPGHVITNGEKARFFDIFILPMSLIPRLAPPRAADFQSQRDESIKPRVKSASGGRNPGTTAKRIHPGGSVATHRGETNPSRVACRSRRSACGRIRRRRGHAQLARGSTTQ
jgi:hypothetical protein